MLNKMCLTVDGYVISIYTTDADDLRLLTEAHHRGTPLGGQYSAQKHPPHTVTGQFHLHVYAHRNQIFAINKDGTAHDASHQVRIPNVVATALRQAFPSWQIPADNVIESCNPSLMTTLLLEIAADSC